jgi:hypothetical protein
MNRLRAAAVPWEPRALQPLALAALPAILLAAVCGALVERPQAHRLMLAIVLAGSLLMVGARWPRGAALATLLFLPFLALGRRLLIFDAGWASQDPLLLVGPAVAAGLLVRIFLLDGRRVVRGRMSLLVVALLLLSVLQVANPAGGGIAVGAAGLLFVAAPLLWFFLGRELATRADVALLVRAGVLIAVFSAIYGLYQTYVGLPSWDEAWREVNGYYALTVAKATRGFGPFSSIAEYAYWLGVGAVFCAALAVRGRRAWLLPIPLLMAAVFVSSVRSVLILAVLGLVVVIALRWFRTLRSAAIAVAVGLVLCVFALKVAGPALSQSSTIAADPLAAHQVGGLLQPLGTQNSTLTTHFGLFVGGIVGSIHSPLGLGPGSTNIASVTVGTTDPGTATEIDVSNAFVSLGLPGGLMFAALVVLVLLAAARRFMASRDVLVLAVLGLLVATLGQWLTGGHYALAPLTWFLVGWMAREAGSERRPARA